MASGGIGSDEDNSSDNVSFSVSKECPINQNEIQTCNAWMRDHSDSVFSEASACDVSLELESEASMTVHESATDSEILSSTPVSSLLDVAIETAGLRKSERVRKMKHYGSSDEDVSLSASTRNQTKKTSKNKRQKNDLHSSESNQTFCCDKCKSPHVVNPSRQTKKKSKKNQYPRHKIDPITNKLLTLCNACGLSLNPKPRKRKHQTQSIPCAEEREKYLQEAQTFALLLADGLNDTDARRLYCPQFKLKGCGCLQRFIKSDGDADESRKRALQLLQLVKEAKQLSLQKCYDPEEIHQVNGNLKGKKARSIGLGNGQKKSRLFEQFVLQNRRLLREHLHLCERATQHILIYSNNFLHKRLKTEPGRGSRVERRKGKAALGLLCHVEDLGKQKCCSENCVSLASTHGKLLYHWRERASMGQAEARRVLAEMLTPCGGARSNCYKFISMVTGCSHSTICRVNEQMKSTGGDREPPEHGLKKYWKEHPKTKSQLVNNDDLADDDLVVPPSQPRDLSPEPNLNLDSVMSNSGSTSFTVTSSDTTLQLEITRQQILQLQRQLAQQQQMIEQQILAQQNSQLQQAFQQALQSSGNLNPVQNPAMPEIPSIVAIQPRGNRINVANIANTSFINRLNNPGQNKDLSNLGSQHLLQNILIDLPTIDMTDKTINIPNVVETTSLSNNNSLLANGTSDFTNSSSQGVNITILQQQIVDGDNHLEQISSQSLGTNFGNLVLIDPNSLVISGNISETTSVPVINSANSYTTLSTNTNQLNTSSNKTTTLASYDNSSRSNSHQSETVTESSQITHIIQGIPSIASNLADSQTNSSS